MANQALAAERKVAKAAKAAAQEGAEGAALKALRRKVAAKKPKTTGEAPREAAAPETAEEDGEVCHLADEEDKLAGGVM